MTALALACALALPSPTQFLDDRLTLGDGFLAGPAQVFALLEGQPAPMSGILVPEERFAELIRAEMELRHVKTRLGKTQHEFRIMNLIWEEKLKAVTPRVRWWEQPAFNRSVGFTFGVAATVLSIWAVSEIAYMLDQ
jgi:hypothetical protein